MMSKGIGKNYLTETIIKYHKSNKYNMYINIEDGYKIPMPKYYRNKIFNQEEKELQAHHIQKVMKEKEIEDLNKKGLEQLEREKLARSMKLISKLNKTKKEI